MQGDVAVAARVMMERRRDFLLSTRGQEDGSGFAEESNSLGTADNFCITLPGCIGHKS